MTVLNILFSILILIQFPSLAQQKKELTFNLQNRVSEGKNSSQTHALWIGMKNPLKFTCSDTTLFFSFDVKGGTILNEKKNHEFDLIPMEKEIRFVMLSKSKDTLHVFDLVARNLTQPRLNLLINKKAIKYEDQISQEDIERLSIKITPDPMLKNDLLEIPRFNTQNVEIILSRDKKTIATVTSFADLRLIKIKAIKNDELVIFVSSISYKDVFSNIVTKKSSEVFRLKIK